MERSGNATVDFKLAWLSEKGGDAMRRKEAPAFLLTDAEGRYTKPVRV